MDISFSGAGFMGCYYFGVVDCWNKYIPKDRVNRVAGASAGSLIAAYYLLDLPLSSCLKKIIELLKDVRSRPLGVFDRSNQIVDILPRVLNELFPEDAHKRVGNRLYVVMTRLKDMKKIVVNEFESKQDLIDALNCSCFIPVWSGNHVSTYKGVKHIDGGFSDNLPVFDEHTIRICCFSGNTDISPYDKSRKELLSGTVLNTPLYFTFANMKRGRRALFPPPPSFIMSMLENGFQDTKNFILDNDLIQCNSCWNKTDRCDQPIYSQISPSITPAISRANSSLNINQLGLSEAENEKNVTGSKKRDFLSPSDVNQKNHLGPPSFSKLLKKKLEKCSQESTIEGDLNNNNTNTSIAPTIVIEDASATLAEQQQLPSRSTSSSSSSSSSSSDGKREEESFCEKRKRRQSCDSGDLLNRRSPTRGQKAFQERRSTLQSDTSLLVLKDKFTLSAGPLPSCPPSPNLNRKCMECARMRQEARQDNLEEEIRIEAEKHCTPEPVREGFTKKLKSPLRWIRQLGQKSSYKFDATVPAQTCEIPAL